MKIKKFLASLPSPALCFQPRCFTVTSSYCSLNEIEDEQHFMLNCTLYLNERQYLFDSISQKYPNFHPLSARNLVILFFWPSKNVKVDH